MAYNSFRNKDMIAEREIAKFLDNYLYTKEGFSNFYRTDGTDNQLSGSDVIISMPNLGIQNAVVDEKASIYYISKDLRTFVLEVSFLNRGYHLSEGWFINEKLSTEYYLIQWIKANVSDPWQVKAENITEIECVLVSKAKLKAYFESEGLGKEELISLSQKMRNENIPNLSFPGKPYRLYYTMKLAEKPVNILLNKEEYIRLSEFHYFIKP